MKKKLYRSRTEKIIAGVSGGLAEYMDVDVTLIRLIWAALCIISWGSALLFYFIAAIIIPQE